MSTDVRPVDDGTPATPGTSPAPDPAPPAAAPSGRGAHRAHRSRRARTTRAVRWFSLLVVLACVGWAVLVQVAVPDACSTPVPPPRAQYLHC